MVESFEFYDLSPYFNRNQKSSINRFVHNTEQEIEFIVNHEFIQSFDHVLYWVRYL